LVQDKISAPDCALRGSAAAVEQAACHTAERGRATWALEKRPSQRIVNPGAGTAMRVSFVVPVFNTGPYLREAIDSIHANASPATTIEILLVDDGSTDEETLELLRQASIEPGVRVLTLLCNRGPSAARNAGIRAAQGEWIAFLDADDLLAPGALQARLAVIDAQPQARWIMGTLLVMTAPGQNQSGYFPDLAAFGTAILPGVLAIRDPARMLLARFKIPQVGTAMLRRDLVEQIGGFNESLKYWEDWYFWLRAACHADLLWIEQPLLHLRRYHTSLSKNLLVAAREVPRAAQAALRDPRFRAQRKMLRWCLAAELRTSAAIYLDHGKQVHAIMCALRAVAWSPTDRRSYASLFSALAWTRGPLR